MTSIKISESEWQVMVVVWTRSAASAAEVVESLGKQKGWHSRTTRTLLDRLVKKRALKVVPEGKRNLYEPLISMEQAVRQESWSFVQRVFGGEPVPLLLHLVGETKLSKSDIKRLKEMLSKKEE
jgi:BlaI family transcriptional regulator, penicillinase repressor